MSAQENLKENALRKVIQELIVPDLNKIRTDVSMLNEKLNGLDSKVESFRNEFKADIKSLDSKVESFRNEFKADIKSLDSKVESFRNEFKSELSRLDGKIDSLDDKIEIRLNSLDEKINLMNKFNEKLFEAVFHKEIK
jgi:outer membrane murein-binding lipoprotein Lpp